MKKFLFITHLTPKRKRSGLRNDLIKIMERSLHGQSYPNWKALWIGEEEKEQSQVKEVALKGESPEQRNESLRAIYEREDVRELIEECDYITKLDDDDVISKNALQSAAMYQFDCYCDRYHTFYDLSSGIITQQSRPWIASTAIHKKEHALTKPGTQEATHNLFYSLFYTEHDKEWIKYYQNKNILYTDPRTPMYLRVLSPTSITAGAKKFPIEKFSDFDLGQYYNYLHSFGAWNKIKVTGFEDILPFLKNAWQSFSGIQQKPIKGISYGKKLKDYIRNYIK